MTQKEPTIHLWFLCYLLSCCEKFRSRIIFGISLSQGFSKQKKVPVRRNQRSDEEG